MSIDALHHLKTLKLKAALYFMETIAFLVLSYQHYSQTPFMYLDYPDDQLVLIQGNGGLLNSVRTNLRHGNKEIQFGASSFFCHYFKMDLTVTIS